MRPVPLFHSDLERWKYTWRRRRRGDRETVSSVAKHYNEAVHLGHTHTHTREVERGGREVEQSCKTLSLLVSSTPPISSVLHRSVLSSPQQRSTNATVSNKSRGRAAAKNGDILTRRPSVRPYVGPPVHPPVRPYTRQFEPHFETIFEAALGIK